MFNSSLNFAENIVTVLSELKALFEVWTFPVMHVKTFKVIY